MRRKGESGHRNRLDVPSTCHLFHSRSFENFSAFIGNNDWARDDFGFFGWRPFEHQSADANVIAPGPSPYCGASTVMDEHIQYVHAGRRLGVGTVDRWRFFMGAV